ncbi:MAG: transporter substrate-binding domain-containing protein [Lentisphaeria bacterium]|nr:transporter substrate-binding domain-containing protein [Lentisphaeria bacterium]
MFFRPAAIFCAALLLLTGALSGTEKDARKVVRVAYQEFNRQMIVDGNNKPVAGYAYEYIQTIGTYAGWDVKYIPCTSFFDSVRLLRAGKVDLIYEISYTEERAKELLFPNEPMGYEYYYLYSSAENTSITPGDHASMNGKTVGVTSGTILKELLQDWSRKKKVNFKYVEYEDISKKEADLYAGKIDLDLELSMLAKRNLSAIEKVGSSAYYLVSSHRRPDLIADINAATEKVLSNDLYYFSRLQERYFSDTALSRNLTAEEKKWIANHKVLRVGFFNNYLPFSAKDENGRPIGAGIETIREIIRYLKLGRSLKVEFICYDDQREGYKAVETGKIDLMIPAYISHTVQQDYRIIAGKSLATVTSNLAYRDDHGADGLKRIGINRNNLMQYYYCRDTYPNTEIVFHDDIQGCLAGLLDGSLDGTFLNGIRSEALLKPGKYHSLRTVRAKSDFQIHMAFAENNIGLMLLMNRGLTILDPDFINKASYSYMGKIYTYSTLDFLQENIVSVIIAVAVVVALIAALIVYWFSNRKLAAINRSLTAYSETIEKQRRQESELREQLEKKQVELKDALQMAQAASRAKTTFLSNMSHDIRTPMNAIVGFTELAASHIHETERVQEYLETISQSSGHLLALINDVLDMSRIESGKMNLHEKEESLADIVHVIREIVHADVQAKQLKFTIEAADIRNELVYCDKLRLNQVLLNLLSNAVKYTDPGGSVSLRIEQKPDADADRGTFEFRVRDTGIGMSDEFAETIFEPFTREENSTVSGIQGTGLGMAISKNIVEMMGGKISVTSKKGEGTEFVVLVDFRLAGRKTSDPAVPELEGARGLAVCGNDRLGLNIAGMLQETGMRSEWCGSAEEAVSRTEEALRAGDPFKVCIVAGPVHGMDEIETVRRIRNTAGKDAFILLLTASEDGEIESEATEAGVNGFVSQPLFPSDLNKALSKLFGKPEPGQTGGEEQGFSLKGKKVLMVDDSELNLKIGVLLLQGQGMKVDTARNGQIAVDMVKEKGIDAYDFIVMDVQMPVMDGYQATAILRKLPGGDKLKIIAFSANAFEEDKEKSLKAGMNGHITKPLKINDLLNELKRFIA